MKKVIFYLLQLLIIIDLIAITIVIFIRLPPVINNIILLYDLIICIILLTEYIFNLMKSKSKIDFILNKKNMIDLIASIPFDLIFLIGMPEVRLLRYFRLLKLIRVISLFNRFFHGLDRFMKNSQLDKILGGLLFTIIIFTLLLYVFGNSYNIFDDFYFVVTTLTTVGYGDITPHSFNEKVITIILLIVGVFIFSTITAGISSFMTEHLMNKDNKNINCELEKMNNELVSLKKEIKELRKELKK